MRRTLIRIGIRIATATAALLIPGLTAAAVQPVAVPGEYLVRPAHGAARAKLGPALDRTGLRAVRQVGRSGWVLTRGDARAMALAAGSGLELEPNYYVFGTGALDPVTETWTPDDPSLALQWHLDDLPASWFTTRGTPSVTVAVLDSGLHLADEAPAFLAPGRDIVGDDFDPADGNGHGTHMASIIAQATDNARLGAAVAPDVTLMPVRVLDDGGRGTVADLAEGIYWAVDHGADVLSMSLALSPLVRTSDTLHAAVQYAAAADVVLVAAAGNHGVGLVSLPAAFNEVIAVGASTTADDRAAYSNYGPALDVVAPGGDGQDRDGDGHPDAIVAFAFDPATGAEGLYLGQGTSQATAYTAGVASLLLAAGEHGRARIRTLLSLTATDLEAPGWDIRTGFGRVDPRAALDGAQTLPTADPSMLPGWTQSPTEPHVIAMAGHHTSGYFVLVEDHLGTWALADAGPGQIGVWRIGLDLDTAMHTEGGILTILEGSGGILGLVESMGGMVTMVESVARVDELLDVAGLGEPLQAAGGVIAIIDTQYQLAGLLEDAGGFDGLLQASGGFDGLLQASGGFDGLLQASGGALAMLEASGGFDGLLQADALVLQPLVSASSEPGRTRRDARR